MKCPNPNHSLRLTLLLGVLCQSVAIHAQDSYEYQSIDLPGSGYTQVFGVNDRGQVAGTGLLPFSYDVRKGEFTLFDEIAGFESTAVLGLNNRGDFVGGVRDPGTGIRSGLILDKNGAATVFDHPDAVLETTARAINSQGLVTGLRDSVEPLTFLAGFIHDPASGTFTDIVPSLATIAQGINGRDEVVGSAIFFAEDDPCDSGGPAGSVVRYGWLRNKQGDVRYFRVNGLNTSARGLNDSGSIAGFTQDVATGEAVGFVTELADAQCQAIAVSADSQVVFPNAIRTFPQSITNAGIVVGEYLDVDGSIRGFVASPR